ncbi:alanine--tRNA ligase [secondary endosymbiont of Ctenarytaina eucalypti]|uniref:Alanine--tRNA ligase n=1 Tax=secondary endosymbiont of Ctenarytaina eucalypti TaxID=1199245 RepID=J3VTJ1_9ENTR|nr:alanine--tRNA ligase [secondary endosymbiont of Ctenarytaina eucalypti]AFP85296.1 alanyl-tRNA synthetase [secondary endosymbiont of Ctenarytaina eucalypti]
MNKSTDQIRQAFLEFFHSKGHQVVESSSLVPDNDTTLLFTNAGMNQFKDVFLGLDQRSYHSAATSQRCVRAGGKHNDLEKVGYTSRHHTFFEMLGNFSFGDYFKHNAISFAWELLTSEQWFNVPKDKLLVTVYANNDDETYNIWAREIGVPIERIIRIGDNKGSPYASDNFWQMGDTGPCGPCSEIFYDHGEHLSGGLPGTPEENGDRYIEIWNLVFMQFNRQADGTLLPLPKPSVDTGMGLERIAAVLQHVNSNYDIDLFKRLIAAAAQATDARNPHSKSLRVIADHIRACAFLISDGVIPSNEGRGYVLRRIIRRAIRHGKMLGASDTFFYKLTEPLIEVMGSAASPLQRQRIMIEQVLHAEEAQFARTLEHGLKLLEAHLNKLTSKTLDGETAFHLYDTYGFPLDLTIDICEERNRGVDTAGFEHAMAAQRNRARQSSSFGADHHSILHIEEKTYFYGYEKLMHQAVVTALFLNDQPREVIVQGDKAVVVLDATPFYGTAGGQVGDRGQLKSIDGLFEVLDTQKYSKALGHFGQLSYGELRLGAKVTAQVDRERREQICLNHSATHLLHTALIRVLGEHVRQKGSLVNDQYLRFDFSHNMAMTSAQIRRVEEIVNQQIRYNLSIQTDLMALEDARNIGAIALFGEKYEEKVRMVRIGAFSTELCGGTHARRTGDLGLFSITSESGRAAGIRRVEAITGEKALRVVQRQRDLMHLISQLVKGDSHTLPDKVLALQVRCRQLDKDLQKLKNLQVAQQSTLIGHNARDINGVKVLVRQVKNVESKMLRRIVNDLKNQLGSAVIILVTVAEGKVSLIASVASDLTDRIKADDIVTYVTKKIGGKGGGRSDLAQGGGSDTAALPVAMACLNEMLIEKL